MKVLMLNGSPNDEGCTKRALKEIETVLNKSNIETEIIDCEIFKQIKAYV